MQGGVVPDDEHLDDLHGDRAKRARAGRRPTRGRGRLRPSPRARRAPAETSSSVALARSAVEQSTSSGRTPFSRGPAADPLRRLASTRCERPIVVGEPGSSQLDFDVTEEPERLHQPRLHPRTSSTWPGVSGEGRSPAIRGAQLGDARDRVAAVEPVAHQPAADHRPRPADAAPAVHVRGAARARASSMSSRIRIT